MTRASNWVFVGAAYAAVWLAIGAYWFYVHSVLKRSRKRFESASAQGEGKNR
jgi:CcmD family protein